MTATILDGKATAAAIRTDLKVRVAKLRQRGVVPGLGTVLVGDDAGSQAYVAGKHRDCAEVGIASIQRELPASATQADVEAVVRELNADTACTGTRAIFATISSVMSKKQITTCEISLSLSTGFANART